MNSYIQTEVISIIELPNYEVKSSPQFVLNNAVNIQTLKSDANTSKRGLASQNKFDNSYTKYLELSKLDTRFNHNFTKVNQYLGEGGYNLNLVRKGYEPYYRNPNIQPNLLKGYCIR